MNNFSAIILAAGQGTRMMSPLPKVMHPVAGTPMLERVIRAVKKAQAREVRVVVGVAAELVRSLAERSGAIGFVQKEQRGTADAVRSADVKSLSGTVIILYGDHPLIETADIEKIVAQFNEQNLDLGVVTCELADPGRFGRIVRQNGQLRAIVEAKDASAETLKIKEINTGIYVVKSELLQRYLPQIGCHNAQGEFYLTDLVSLAVEAKCRVSTLEADMRVSLGVNTQAELAQASRQAYLLKAQQLMESGVTLINPADVYIDDSVRIGAGSVIFPGVYLFGKTQLGAYCVVEPGCVLKNSRLHDHVVIKAGCYLEEAEVGSNSELGPYAHLRPETIIGSDCKVGNFVEMKKVKFGNGAKASHLTYLGDSVVGENTNIGCGTITCNYAVDRKKYVTEIGRDVFVGSDTQFIAPIKIGDGAVIGSGSTITKDVPAGALAVARSRQVIKENYNQPKSSDHEPK